MLAQPPDFAWRPQGDLNPCRRRERPKTGFLRKQDYRWNTAISRLSGYCCRAFFVPFVGILNDFELRKARRYGTKE